MSTVIDVRDVSKKYRLYDSQRDTLRERFVGLGRSGFADFWALQEINFHVDAGDTFGIIGHNGSGKSTLLRLMAGVHRPTSGSVRTTGRVGALLELGAGFHPELTGRENVLLNAAILGLPSRYVRDRLDEIAEFAGVEQFFDSPIKAYSSGMAMRLGFATAVHIDPDILLVDEAIAVGDEEFQRKCMDHLHRLRHAGTTVVLVSHSLNLIAELCDRVLWLDGGRPRMVDDAATVIDTYLREINRRESDLAAADPTVPDVPPDSPETASRIGSGEIRVLDVEFIGSDGHAVDALLTSQPCTFRIHYEAACDVDDVTFGLGFATENGIRVAGPNSGYGELAVAVAAGRGTVEFGVSELVLQPSHYRVSAAAVTRNHVLDHIENGFELAVHPSHAVTEPGLVRMLGRWIHGAT